MSSVTNTPQGNNNFSIRLDYDDQRDPGAVHFIVLVNSATIDAATVNPAQQPQPPVPNGPIVGWANKDTVNNGTSDGEATFGEGCTAPGCPAWHNLNNGPNDVSFTIIPDPTGSPAVFSYELRDAKGKVILQIP